MYMLANNNQQVISRMALRSIKSNRRRSAVIIGAIVLSAFMVFIILTAGATYFKMQQLQNIRMGGGEFDAVIYGITEEQQRICVEHPDIKASGIGALAGAVEETKADQTPNVGLIWADETYWNTLMEPAREWVKGEYPQEANEIMATREALKECGMEQLGVGDLFAFTYSDALGDHTKEFRISGMWDGFGPKRIFYVSKAFYEESGMELSDVGSGRYFIDWGPRLITQ
jgi:putative ABC transport system permease protein